MSGLIRFRFNGAEIAAQPGQTVAAALLAAGVRTLGRNPVDGRPTGMFCAMGICQECAVVIDGQRVEACRVVARAGIDVRSE